MKEARSHQSEHNAADGKKKGSINLVGQQKGAEKDISYL